ncbi:MAG TPA: four helix bundle protein [Bacteroidota bacterium]|nr:four helix bundle protein [Bacteroidota bacterium]
MTEYTQRRNVNRGYMKLEVWQNAIQLYQLVHEIVYKESHIDFKLRSQIDDAAQSVSSNIAEGYGRRSIHEYLQYLYISAGSLAETLTRAVGLKVTNQISGEQLERIDSLHYEVENKLIRLIESLENKRDSGSWVTRISEEMEPYNP